MERSGEALVIRPKEKLKIGHIEHNPDILERVYQIGRKTGEEKLQEVKRFIAK